MKIQLRLLYFIIEEFHKLERKPFRYIYKLVFLEELYIL